MTHRAARSETVAVIGGTGHLGRALARRWAKAGLDVIVGSRDVARAASTAAEIGVEGGRAVRGASYVDATRAATIVVVAVPFGAQEGVLAEIRDVAVGKIIVDATVPLVPPKVMRVQLPEEDSAAVRAQRLLGEGSVVVSAFHNVAAHRLATDEDVPCDVLIFGDDRYARDRVVALAAAAGLRGLHAGALANSTAAEALTSVLIFINKHYAVDGAGVRITGLQPSLP